MTSMRVFLAMCAESQRLMITLQQISYSLRTGGHLAI